VRYVPHHVAHAASAYLAGPYRDCAVMVMDGRGEQTSYLCGVVRGGELDVLRRVAIPHSLGLRYEELTVHVGFMRSSDEYKVMALASYGKPRWLPELREAMHFDGDGGFVALPVDFGWRDIGDWAALYDMMDHDEDGNAVEGRHVGLDTHNSLIVSPKRLMATIGLRDLIVVDTEDVLLVMPRDRAQDVKKILDRLKESGQDGYL